METKSAHAAGSARWLLLAVVATAAAVVLAVTILVGSRGGGGDSTSTGLGDVDAKDAVVGFDPSLNARTELALIHAAAEQDPEALRTIALDQLASNSSDVRWAALYALSVVVEPGDPEGAAALMQSLGSTDVDERLAAASGLVAVGERAAVPVLIAILESTETTQYIVMPCWRVARGLLLTHVNQDLGLRDADSGRTVAAAMPAWQTWWAEHGPSLAWDKATGTFG